MTAELATAARPRRLAAALRGEGVRVLLAALGAQCAISFAEQGIPSLNILIKHDLGLSAAASGALVSALGIGRIVAFYPAGRAVDRYGEIRLLLVASVGTGISVAAASAFGYRGILVAFGAAGIFLSAAAPAGGKLVFASVPHHRRGLAMGLRQAGVPIGGVLAAATLPFVAAAGGWRAAVLTAGVVAAVLGVLSVLSAGVASMPVRETRRSVVDWHSLLTREYVIVTIWGGLLVGGQYALLTFFALDVAARTGISRGAAAALIIFVQLGGIAGRIGWGIAVDRRPHLGSRGSFAALTGLGVLTSAVLALPISDIFVLVGLALLAGLSINSWQGLWTARIAEIAGIERAGTATGVALTFVGISITASTPLYGLVADAAGTYRAVWVALGAVLAVALVVLSAVPKTRDAG